MILFKYHHSQIRIVSFFESETYLTKERKLLDQNLDSKTKYYAKEGEMRYLDLLSR